MTSEKKKEKKKIDEVQAAVEDYVFWREAMEAGDECPNCHCGTLEETDEEFVCQGECGEVWPKE